MLSNATTLLSMHTVIWHILQHIGACLSEQITHFRLCDFVVAPVIAASGRICTYIHCILCLVLFIGSRPPRLTPSKVDIFSALCSIRVGVARVFVSSFAVVSGEWAEEKHWWTFCRIARSRRKDKNEMMKKLVVMIESKLLRMYSWISWWRLLRLCKE